MNGNPEKLPGTREARELGLLQAQMLRPAQEVNKDGSFELGWGFALLCFGLGPYLNAVITKSSWFSAWTAWAGMLPLVCAAFAPYAVPKVIKRFITWPRAGYVANPNEMKLKELVMLMVFGGALGGGIGLLFTLVVGALEGHSQASARTGLHFKVLAGIGLLACAFVTVYLGRKVIRKRPPLPMAYDAAVLTGGLGQTAVSRKHLRMVRFALVGLFVGIPLVVFGIVFGLLYGRRLLLSRIEIHWPELGLPGFLMAANALLYFMGSGLVLKPHRWKWFVLPMMLLAPMLAAPAISYPATQVEWAAGLAPVMLCLGAVWCLSGAITLLLFVRRNPIPPAEAP